MVYLRRSQLCRCSETCYRAGCCEDRTYSLKSVDTSLANLGIRVQIKFAATSKIPLLTTGGAHGFPTTLGLVKCGIELDMSNFNKVVVDAKANKLTIGGGVRFGDILVPMTQAKKEMRE